jgi:hypothetical protein
LNAVSKVIALALVLVICALSIGLAISLSFFTASSKTSTVTNNVTLFSNQTIISPSVTTLTKTLTNQNATKTSILNVTQTSTDFVVVAVTTLPKTPFNYTSYLAMGSIFGGCYENSFPQPCFTADLSQAEVFNCVAEASTQSGCTTLLYSPPNYSVGSTQTSFAITVWYPYISASQDEPAWANCKFTVQGSSAPPYAFCITISPTLFLLSIAGTPQA